MNEDYEQNGIASGARMGFAVFLRMNFIRVKLLTANRK